MPKWHSKGNQFDVSVNLPLSFPGDSVVKNLPAMQEMWVRSLGQEDPLEEGTATHSSILAWRILRTEEPGGLPSMGSRVVHDRSNSIHMHGIHSSLPGINGKGGDRHKLSSSHFSSSWMYRHKERDVCWPSVW